MSPSIRIHVVRGLPDSDSFSYSSTESVLLPSYKVNISAIYTTTFIHMLNVAKRQMHHASWHDMQVVQSIIQHCGSWR